ISAVAVGVDAVREAARTPINCDRGRARSPETAGRAGRRYAAATQPCSGGGLVTLGGPWVDEEAVVEAVDHQASGVTQYHCPRAGGQGWAPEPLVGHGSPLIARRRHNGVTHNCVDLVVLRQRSVERDAGAEWLGRLLACGRKGRRRAGAATPRP